jgi:G:T/U-mismatch repair DNA glycosylase
MSYKTICVFNEEVHDWGHYIPEGATRLLIGTFPTKKSERKFDFFYSGARNRFWAVMSGLTGVCFQHRNGKEAIAERKSTLDQLKLGITDIGYRVYRQKESSLDHHLLPVEFNDVFGLLESYRSINTLIITSSSGGNSALSWFAGYCDLNNVRFSSIKKVIPWQTKLTIRGRVIQVIVCYSTSSTFRKLDVDKLTDHYRQVLGIE